MDLGSPFNTGVRAVGVLVNNSAALTSGPFTLSKIFNTTSLWLGFRNLILIPQDTLDHAVNSGLGVGVECPDHSFDGAIIVHRIHDSTRAFYYEVTFNLAHPQLIKLALAERPPMHFHPHQDEYIKVLSGSLGVDVEKTEYRLRPQDGELRIPPWANHRLYPHLTADDDVPASDSSAAPLPKTTRFLLSAEQSAGAFRLDDTFFQNWYGYQEEVVMSGGRFDFIQVMNMFDAGGSYLTFPTWIPSSRRLAQFAGIIIGRWLGGLLGYQPFHRRWTSNWPLACEKMATSVFLRRFPKRTKAG